MHQIVQDAIARTDLDLRKALYLNIVLSGGSTLCKNFPDRLMREIKKLAVEDMKIRVNAPAERKYTTWIGGGILAGLNTFRKVSWNLQCPIHSKLQEKPHIPFLFRVLISYFPIQMWVSADEWHEDPDIIHKKCP